MPRKRSKAVVPKVEAVAKVSAEAKAIRKKIIKETIPEDVTRSKWHTLRTLLSPLVEYAGRKGAEQRHQRRLERLEQELDEDILKEVVFRTRQRLSQDVAVIKPVPLKFMVPFLEKASLEEPASELIDLWASLLASASEEFSPHQTHFISIISDMSSVQGRIFKRIIRTEKLDVLQRAMEAIKSTYGSLVVERGLEQVLPHGGYDRHSDVIKCVVDFFDRSGIEMVHASYFNMERDIGTEARHNIEFSYSQYESHREAEYSILEALGLIRGVQTNVGIGYTLRNAGQWVSGTGGMPSVLPPPPRLWYFEFTYYHLTQLGFEFAKACKIVS